MKNNKTILLSTLIIIVVAYSCRSVNLFQDEYMTEYKADSFSVINGQDFEFDDELSLIKSPTNQIWFTNKVDSFYLILKCAKELESREIQYIQTAEFNNRLNANLNKCNAHIENLEFDIDEVPYYFEVLFEHYDSYNLVEHRIENSLTAKTFNKVKNLIKVKSVIIEPNSRMEIQYTLNGKIDDTFLFYNLSREGEILEFGTDG